MATRIIVRIELTPQAKNHLNDLSERTGMTQVAMLSRLVEWFAGQSGMVQAAVLNRYPDAIAPDVVRLILQRMIPPPTSPAAGHS